MKKFFTILFLFLTCLVSCAENWDSKAALERVNTVGNKILKANGVNYKIEFMVSNVDEINAYADSERKINVYRGMLEYVTSDDELAAVISHEIGHIINGHNQKGGVVNAGLGTVVNAVNVVTANSNKNELITIGVAATNTLAAQKLSRHDEFEADITGVDLMTNAGYSPLGMISLLGSINQSFVDILVDHPSGPKRIIYAYDYAAYNYPKQVAKGYNSKAYNEAMEYVKPVLAQRANNPKLQAKYEKTQKKLLKNKIKRARRAANGKSAWDGYYNLLKTLAY